MTLAPVNGLGFATTETELVDVRIIRSFEGEGGDEMSPSKDDIITGGVVVALGVISEPRINGFYQSQSLTLRTPNRESLS